MGRFVKGDVVILNDKNGKTDMVIEALVDILKGP